MPPRANDLLAGRYRLVTPRGRGGMAEVWVAEDQQLHRQVAIKVMAAHLLDDPRALERFRREGRAVARLNHPNVVALYDAASDGDVHFLVMELLDGESLADRLRAGPLEVGEALDVLDQVAAGLGAAHAEDLVHRDVKPSNILFAADGTAKVADFGVATAVAASATVTHTVHGSVPYLAPEQASGAAPDTRTDLYALGCVAFEMLTGSPPFTGDTAAAVISQHLHTLPPEVAVGGDRTADGLVAVVRRLLAKDPADRHPSAAALRADLARVRRGDPPAAHGPDTLVAPLPVADVLRDDPTAALPGVTPPAAMPATAALPQDPPPPAATDPPGTSRRRPWPWAVAAAVLAVVVAVALLDDRDDETVALADVVTAVSASPTPAGATTPSPSPATPTTPAPTATPSPGPDAIATPTPAPPPSTPAPPATATTSGLPEAAVAAIAAIRDLVADGVERGQLDDEGAAAVEDALARPRDVDGLHDTVAVLVEQGHANPGIGNQLDAAIDELAAALA